MMVVVVLYLLLCFFGVVVVSGAGMHPGFSHARDFCASETFPPGMLF